MLALVVTACGPGDDEVPQPTFKAPQSSTPADPASATVVAPPPASTSATALSSGLPPYESSVEPVTEEQLGATWRAGCPVGPDELRLVRLSYATPDGTSATGELVVAASVADDVIAAFGDLYAAGFPITRMETIDAYGADDDRSMAADNTSGFNCRDVTGGTGWSRHSYGEAVDINPLINPYVEGDTVLPAAGAAYLDRSDVRPGMIVAGDLVVQAFTSRGFEWGGDFETLKDYQHFAR